jgi:hypothetical protein
VLRCLSSMLCHTVIDKPTDYDGRHVMVYVMVHLCVCCMYVCRYHRVAQKGLTVAVNYWHDMAFDHKYVYHNFLMGLAAQPSFITAAAAPAATTTAAAVTAIAAEVELAAGSTAQQRENAATSDNDAIASIH